MNQQENNNKGFWNKLTYRVTIITMLPIISVSIILSIILYQSYSIRYENDFKSYLEEVVFNHINYFDSSLDKVSAAAFKDANLITAKPSLDSTDFNKIVVNNLQMDSIIFGSGIFFDDYDYKGDNSRTNYIYAYKTNKGRQIKIQGAFKNPIAEFDYLTDSPEWWSKPNKDYQAGWTEPYYDELSDSTLMVTYYQPFFYDENFAGVVTIDISFNELSKWLKKNDIKNSYEYKTKTYLLSKSGKIIYTDKTERIGEYAVDTNNRNKIYSNDAILEITKRVLDNKKGAYIIRDEKGEKKYLSFYSGLKATDWKQVTVLPYSTIDNVIKTAMMKFLIIAILFNVFLIVLIVIIARYFSIPIKKLTAGSIAVAQGNFDTPLQIKNSTEIGTLASNFSFMAQNLKKRENDLRSVTNKLQQIFNAAPIGIIYFDTGLNIISNNPKSNLLLGFTSTDNLIGVNLNEIVLNRDWAPILKETLNTGESKVFEIESPFDEKSFLHVNIEPLKGIDKVVIGILVIINDITEQKRNTELTIENEAALKASKAKSLFLANMSHEIRTPMNAIIGLSHLMTNTDLNQKQINYLKKINSSANHLLGVINDILDFSKIEAGKIKLENYEFDLENSLKEINNIFSFTASEKNLEFVLYQATNIPNLLIGDELRLKQILINFISNSIKFTPKGEIVLGVEKSPNEYKDKVELIFSVRDTGIGMTKEQSQKVFGAFSQADESTTRKFGGTGLGLSISKHLVELFGGKIAIESEIDKGTTISFNAFFGKTLQNEKQSLIPTNELIGSNVLVCDDNKTVRMVVENTLKSFSFNTKSFANAESLIEQLENSDQEYKFIVLDWKMPGMDGLEAAKIIKTNKKLKTIPKIILLTAYSELESDVEKTEFIDEILYKPITNSTFFDTIMNVLGNTNIIKNTSTLSSDKNNELIKQYQGIKILLVEDNEINQEVATEFFESLGLVVEVASNGKIAVEKIAEADSNEYSLIFMDLQMPVMDGFTATEKIRQDKKFDNIPIVAMTADVMEDVKEKCLSIGMKGFISKPINPPEIINAIVKWAVKPDEKKRVGNKKPMTIETKTIKPENQTNDIVLPDIPGLNTKSALGRLNNKKKLYLSIIEKFYNNNQNVISEIKNLMKKEDFETAKRVIHTLKGVSGNIGAESVHEKSKLVEKNIIEKNTEKLNKELEELDKDLKNLFRNISEKLKLNKKVENKDLNIELVNGLLPELRLFIEKKSPKAKAIVEKLEEAGMAGDDFEEVKKTLNKYDFKAAIESLIKIENKISL